MSLVIKHIDEDTGVNIIVKNDGDKVLLHNSDNHDPDEFVELTDRVMRISNEGRHVINAFYDLASRLNIG